MLSKSQVRVSMDGVYAFDYHAVVEVGKALGLRVDKVFFRFLAAFEEEYIKAIRGKHK
jgi:hypothetical protein